MGEGRLFVRPFGRMNQPNRQANALKQGTTVTRVRLYSFELKPGRLGVLQLLSLRLGASKNQMVTCSRVQIPELASLFPHRYFFRPSG